ncbi:unnamed protein product [Leptosia nina]|uniref:R3H domain-containing protein n=1 Tax=Leptosia nina TaxID=320188 RepID=A0AAV1J8H5_9NEOP
MFVIFIILQIVLGAKTVERFLHLADDNFIEDVREDLKCFLGEKKVDSVLVFPPVSNYRRFLIHRCVEQLSRPELTTFSIGVNDERRTVVCYRDKLLSDEACARPIMGLTQTQKGDAAQNDHCPVGSAARAQPLEKPRSASTKPRRPDRAVYVPRALRGDSATEENKSTENKRTSHSADGKCPKSPASKEKSVHGTPKRSLDKNFCNVYTPPHLRNQRSHTAPDEASDHLEAPSENIDVPFSCEVPNGDSAISYSDSSYKELEVGESFYIGDYFANGQLGFYTPGLYEYTGTDGWRTNETEDLTMSLAETQGNIIDKDYLYDKDEDIEKIELKRASQEINRSSKRIIKQTFDSDVLVISDPIEEPSLRASPQEKEENDVPKEQKAKSKPKLEAKVSVKREENDWDAVFDDSGECLDPSLIEELTSTVGKVHISKAKNNYDQYQTRGQALFNGPYDETFAHVVEVYDFPSEFKTNDLLSLFSEYKDTGFEIKWVDDTHALIVFSSAKIAAEVLSTQRSLAKCRPLHAATLESRNKAKKCAEFLQPYRQRPETCTALARRLVSGALGVRLSTARQERDEERRLITIAREKKRKAALHKEAAWDGSLANTLQSLDT